MYHNGEQNLVTNDPQFVGVVQQHLQTEVIQHSNVFQAKKGFLNKLTLSLKGILTQMPNKRQFKRIDAIFARWKNS